MKLLISPKLKRDQLFQIPMNRDIFDISVYHPVSANAEPPLQRSGIIKKAAVRWRHCGWWEQIRVSD
jgi:hypothetical protein